MQKLGRGVRLFSSIQTTDRPSPTPGEGEIRRRVEVYKQWKSKVTVELVTNTDSGENEICKGNRKPKWNIKAEQGDGAGKQGRVSHNVKVSVPEFQCLF